MLLDELVRLHGISGDLLQIFPENEHLLDITNWQARPTAMNSESSALPIIHFTQYNSLFQEQMTMAIIAKMVTRMKDDIMTQSHFEKLHLKHNR